MNSDMLINRPKYYGGGEYTGDKAALKCAGVFHRKFRDKSDERLAGADGVIFDHESAVFTDVDGWFNQNRKLHMDGWAIKFVEPTHETIRARLATPVTSVIDVVQLRPVHQGHGHALRDRCCPVRLPIPEQSQCVEQ